MRASNPRTRNAGQRRRRTLRSGPGSAIARLHPVSADRQPPMRRQCLGIIRQHRLLAFARLFLTLRAAFERRLCAGRLLAAARAAPTATPATPTAAARLVAIAAFAAGSVIALVAALILGAV